MPDSSKPVDSSGQTSAEKIAAAQKRLAKTRALTAQGMTFKYFPSQSTMRAFDKFGTEIGSMELDKPNRFGNRVIKQMKVDAAGRGNGVASAMFTEAQRQKLFPAHSSTRTDMGEAFAKSTGTYVPPRETSAPGRVNSRVEPNVVTNPRLAGLGNLTGGVLSYLPMLMQAGNIATGKYVDPMFSKPGRMVQ